MIRWMLGAAGIAGSTCYGDELVGLQKVSQEHPHHLYLGPEVFLFDLNMHFQEVHVDGLKLFGGLQLGYEYLKPESFYCGIDVTIAGGNQSFHDSYGIDHFPGAGGTTGFGNIELRLGYTFAPERWMISPFFGVGGYAFGYGSNSHHFDGGMSYLAGGVHVSYQVLKWLSIGVNFKIFESIYTNEEFKFLQFKRVDHRGLWGGEVGIPVVWLLGLDHRWNVRLEPYYLNLDVSNGQNSYGMRLLFGYRW